MRKYPAIQSIQHKQVLYQLSIPAADLLEITKADIWNADLNDLEASDPRAYLMRQGYQREPMPRHYMKVSNYVNRADSFLPTSVLLSAREKKLTFLRDAPESNVGTLQIREEDLPLWEVDGQHRLKGIRHVIEEKGRTELRGFPVLVCIADNLTKYEEIQQFHIVNTTAKGVRSDLADRLMLLMEEWHPNSVRSVIPASQVWQLRATKLTAIMNEQKNSPWEGRIRAPNTGKGGTIISERSFSTSLKPILLDSTISNYTDEGIVKWLTAFWVTVADLMPEAFEQPQDYAVQKTPGVYIFHMVIPRIFSLWLRDGKEGRAGIQRILSANPQISEYFTNAQFWRSGSGEGAGTTGMGGFARLANDITDVLPEVRMPEIETMTM